MGVVAVTGIFKGRFRSTYLVVKVLTFYASTYLIFYFWPKFIGRVVLPDFSEQMTVIAGSFLTPLGFLAAAFYFGKRVFAIHIAVLIAACSLTWLLWPGDMEFNPPNLNERFAPVMIGGYLVASFFGWRVELERAPWDPPTD